MKIRQEQRYIRKLDRLFKKNSLDNQIKNEDDLTFLIQLVKLFRPFQISAKTSVSIRPLLEYLHKNHEQRQMLISYLKKLLSNRKFRRMASDAGILQDSDFMYEVKKRFWAKLLPYQPEKETYEYILNQVFYKHTDSKWVKKIAVEELTQLFDKLEFTDIFNQRKEGSVLDELLNSIGLLTQRMSGRAMESSIIRMIPEYSHFESPFLALEKEFLELEVNILQGKINYLTEDDPMVRQIFVLYKQCREFVDQAFKNSAKYGISIRVNQSLLRLRQQLQRVERLFSLLIINNNDVAAAKKTKSVELGVQLIEYNCYKYNVKGLLKESTQLLAYEITQHSAKTGEHYITSTSKEYWKMFKTAMGAGVIVGFLCIFKVYAHHTEISDFGHAFLYSLNYAFGFVLIYLLGFTLATKQPAMTAATIIKSIEAGLKSNLASGEKHFAFAKLFAQLFRSQFIAFIGNVILAFPVALGLVWAIDSISGNNIVASDWEKILTDASPIHSKALFHAGIAGIFLFMSGIISGKVANKNKHNNVYYRIQEHPWLKSGIGKNNTQKLAGWVEKKWPGVVSNIWFGIFMGTCGTIGTFIGLDIDIRHITFVSGNIALGIYGSGFAASIPMMVWAFIGIWLVGSMNFLVSFSLSLLLAFRSRNIPIKETVALAKSTWRYFKSFPVEFFLPSKISA